MEIDVCAVRLCAPDAVLQQAWQWLSAQEISRAERYRFEENRRSFVLARGALRMLLAIRLRMAPSEIVFHYGPQGKPSLSSSSMRFNLSHSGRIAAYAFALDYELGIDIEELRPVADFEQIARQFFHGREYETMTALADQQRSQAFFRAWVQKEAHIKALGGGLSVPLDSFCVTVDPNCLPGLFEASSCDIPLPDWHVHEFSPMPGYIGALAWRSTEPCVVKLRRVVSIEELLASRGHDGVPDTCSAFDCEARRSRL